MFRCQKPSGNASVRESLSAWWLETTSILPGPLPQSVAFCNLEMTFCAWRAKSSTAGFATSKARSEKGIHRHGFIILYTAVRCSAPFFHSDWAGTFRQDLAQAESSGSILSDRQTHFSQRWGMTYRPFLSAELMSPAKRLLKSPMITTFRHAQSWVLQLNKMLILQTIARPKDFSASFLVHEMWSELWWTPHVL